MKQQSNGPPYTNLDETTPDKSLADLLRWQVLDRVAGRRRVDRTPFVPPRVVPERKAFASSEARLGWVGHATFAMRLGGQLVATDPVWSAGIHTVSRVAPPGIELADLPQIDVVTVSHSHYDHMDLPTLRRIGRDALYIVPKDNGGVLRSAGLRGVVELAWWESHEVGDLRVTLVPAQHWSMRSPWDKNRRLWGGFVFESAEGTAYHAGDTAFSERVFSAIAARFPRIDAAMLPIGAYDPPWFMQPQHQNPEEAGRAFELLGARRLVAMHWGTFRLTDEPLGEPPERLRSWWTERGLPSEALWIPALGEARAFG
jgi:L-ascorbate metabolism protein UlaG (beta-lactamase superfamily)